MTLSLPVRNVRRLVLGCLLALVIGAGMRFYDDLHKLHLHSVLSASMAPSLPVGSLIVVKEASPSSYQVGDVVSFYVPTRPREIITHRIIRLYRDGYGMRLAETKGDANTSGDPWTLSMGNIRGKEVMAIPLVGYLAYAAHLPSGFLAIVVASFFLIVVPVLGQVFEVRQLFSKGSGGGSVPGARVT